MSSLRPESHVPQQIRREKFRSQNSCQHLQEFPEQFSQPPGFNLDLVQVRNVRNANMLDEQAVYSSSSSQLPNYSTASNPLEYHQELASAAEPSNRLMLNQFGSSFPHSHKEQCDIRNLGNWRNVNSATHQGSENWFVNYANNANSFIVSDLNSVSSYNDIMDVQCSNAPLYQNALQDIVKSASVASSLMQQNEHCIWVGNASEVELQPQPSYENQTNQLHFANTSLPQSLSLSLSSNASQPKPFVSHLQQGSALDCGKSVQDTVVVMSAISKNNISYRNVGPLGPFTGYATILKSSKFLKSAQQLLDEICCLSVAKFGKSYDVSERVSPEVSASTSADTVTVKETGVVAAAAKVSSNSGSSSSMLYNNISKENSADGGVGSSSFCLSSRPDYQQKKAKLLYMQEQVTRQCKQYHLQMQMVVSSFDSVAGLGSATPYIPLALKSVSKHFRCLKNSISEQLKRISEALGDDLSIPSTSTTCINKADTNMARIRGMDQSFLKNNKPGMCTAATELVESQQHAWRPQRGLPERAVAILKAWLFEHFLHPYPTDTDKHMLASQTGLSRNQVSNWFINARVRVWKPMVEEIHMLETKGTGSKDKCGKNEGTSSGTEGDTSQPKMSNIAMNSSIPENQFQSMEVMGSSSSIAANAEESALNSEEWSQEKRSKLECQMNSNMEGAMMGFAPYRRGSIEVGGLGSVSLTLGLRHGVVEGVQQHLQEDQLRHHHHGVGGHMFHDYFVG